MRLSRTNSIGAISDDNPSLYIAKEPVLSEADSDDRRKRLSSELRKAFDHYLGKNASQPNITGETLAS